MTFVFRFVKGCIPQKLMEEPVGSQNFQSGAKASFKGCVRNDMIGGKEVTGIDFTTHEEIATTHCKHLMRDVSDKYGLHAIAIYHSLGFIKAGDTCFYVEVHSAHRKEVFLALPVIVDLFKSKIPIFGKEIMSNGESHWKENKY